MEHNFREQGNSVKMNFGEHQNLFLGNKGEIAIFCREQGNPPWEALCKDCTILLMCGSRKYPYSPLPSLHGRILEIMRRKGLSKAKLIKGKYEASLESVSTFYHNLLSLASIAFFLSSADLLVLTQQGRLGFCKQAGFAQLLETVKR